MKFILIVLAIVCTSAIVVAQDEQDKIQELFGKGLNAFNKGNYGEAVVFYTKCIERDSLTMNVWFNRASAYLRLRDYGKAKEDLDHILVRQPELLNARMQRAVVEAEMGLLPMAIEDVSTVIRQDSTFPKAYLLRGRMILRANLDTLAACSDLKAALALGDSTALRYMTSKCNQ
ncbi:MAG: tetratricopeptide repeat protein [Candidatus Kapabacteria bacterium]|nr:tetratricopeptide repeat protein [Candidatus Kapabacteria bacterium]